MTPYVFFPLVCFTTFLVLGFFVLFHKPRSTVKTVFSLLCFEAFYWQVVWFVSFFTSDSSYLDYLAKISYLAISFLPFTFYHFIMTYLGLNRERKYVLGFYGLGLILVLLLPTNLFVRGHRHFSWGNFAAPGPLYPLFMLSALVTMTRGIVLLTRAVKSPLPYGVSRNQLSYIFLGLGLYYSCAVDFAQVYGASWYPLGVFFFLGSFSVICYAIIRHRVMDIEVVIKKTLVFTGIFAFFFGTFAFLSFLVTDVLQRSATLPVRLAIFAVGAAVSALVGNRLHTFLVNATDRFLFQKKYVYYRILKENSKQMAFIHSLDELAKQITGFLVKQGRVKNAAIFVQSDDGQHYVLKFPLGYGGRTKRPTITLDQNHPLVELLSEYRGPIQTEELESKKDTDYQEALRILKLLKAEVVVPSFLRTASHENEPALKPRNILILGSKKSDQPYGEEDLDVFFTIAQDSAIAAENARLFDVVLKEREAKIKAEHIAERVWFAGTIKHEVKNRLAAGIIGPANILRIHHTPDLKKAFEEGDKEWFQEIFSKIENINKGLLDGAQMVLDIADTTLGGLEPDQTKFRRIYFKILWNDAKRASGIEKHCDFESSIPDGFVIYGNYPVIMRVFENLLTNAYDAMKDQNEKLIKLRCSYQQVEGKSVSYCELEDNGHGIPEDIQSKIFERGFSTKPEPDDKDLAASGHGQGLYVCKMNVEKLHGGKIWVESKVGKGTIFKLWIPTEGSNNAEK